MGKIKMIPPFPLPLFPLETGSVAQIDLNSF